MKDSEIWVADGNGTKARKITDGGTPKFLPVWSPEGERIAFARENVGVLADIVVVSYTGSVLMQTAFRAAGSNISGMRFVESVAWLSKDKILLGGSVDPSTVEYSILSAETGQELGGYLANGFSLRPAPNGEHVAYQGYIPHFSLQEGRRFRFCLDHECDFDKAQGGYAGPQGENLEFASGFVWSPDSLQVAAVERRLKTKETILVSRTLDGRTRTQQVRAGTESIQPEWRANRDGFIASLKRASSTSEKSEGAGSDVTLRDLRDRFRADGNMEPDFWCASCPFRNLPRSNGPSSGR